MKEPIPFFQEDHIKICSLGKGSLVQNNLFLTEFSGVVSSLGPMCLELVRKHFGERVKK